MTVAALRHVRQIAQATTGEVQYCGGRQPAVLTFKNFQAETAVVSMILLMVLWMMDGLLLSSDGGEDITIMINSSSSKFAGSQYSNSFLPSFGSGVLCAKASMLMFHLVLIRFLREHRAEWADYGVDAYSAASLRATPFAVPCVRTGGFPSNQVILPLAQTLEHEEFLEVVRLGGHAYSPGDMGLSQDMYLLQLCSGIDENVVGGCAQLVFAPIDESFADDAPLLPSGFRVIPLDQKATPNDHLSANRTRDLASSLDGSTKTDAETNSRLVLTIAFQFTYDNHSRDNVAAMARQYVRNVVGSIQRVALAITPRPGSLQFPTSPEALTLVRWISRSYSIHTGANLLGPDSQACDGDTLLKQLWNHTDAILCCSLKTNASPVFTFANQAGLDMLETTLVALQDIMLDKTLDDSGRKALCSEFSKIMQQGYANLPAGLCVSSMGRPVSYEQATVWKVLDDNESNHCLAFILVNWSFV
ncbi:unnamed protein product [Microthlaspi erraticum]|uniref:MEKHLA domain-containing protein n=1 Tax=Microthlaspi erraticum TaxID=1685480 RepID=A0A6D2KZ77_9BRAS|nr:unnamed protein product [Microthlaspi erraticum]